MIQMILRKQDKVGLKAYYNDRNMAEDKIYASPLNIFRKTRKTQQRNKNHANREINKRTSLQNIICRVLNTLE